MEPKNSINELQYTLNLISEITLAFPNCEVYAEKKYGKFRPDISIELIGNRNIIIEIKNSRNYSSLPFSTIMQLEDYKLNIPNSEIILISLSDINELMKEKLKEMQIKTFIKPEFISIIKYLKEKNVT